jgi:hypothetical protein
MIPLRRGLIFDRVSKVGVLGRFSTSPDVDAAFTVLDDPSLLKVFGYNTKIRSWGHAHGRTYKVIYLVVDKNRNR